MEIENEKDRFTDLVINLKTTPANISYIYNMQNTIPANMGSKFISQFVLLKPFMEFMSC